MVFIEENFEYVVTSLLIFITVLILIIFRYNIYLTKFFSNKKFRVNSKYELEPLTGQKSFTLNIFNNNVNDSRIIAFGYIYNNHNIDYYKTYLKNNNLTETTKIIIPSRDCVIGKIDALNLKTIISDMNKGRKRVKRIKSFVSDSQGLTYKSKASMVSKQLSCLLDQDYLKAQEEKKQIRLKLKAEKLELKRKISIDRKLKRKEKINKIKLKIKSFRKNKK